MLNKNILKKSKKTEIYVQKSFIKRTKTFFFLNTEPCFLFTMVCIPKQTKLFQFKREEENQMKTIVLLYKMAAQHSLRTY